MGRYINPDAPMSDEDKDFLRKRARGDEVIENERRFPPDGTAAEHEAEGYMPTKVGYDYNKQADKIEDAGGLEVERIPTDDEGRPMVKEYGYVEGIVKSDDFESEVDDNAIAEDQAKEPESEDGEIDDDILERVLDMTVEELKDELEKLDQKKSGNKEELIDRLANALQDKRDAENAE